MPVFCLLFFRTCVSECPPGFFRDDKRRCKKCSPLCESCIGSRSDQCTSCRPGLYLREGANTCVYTCPEGTYLDLGKLPDLHHWLNRTDMHFILICRQSIDRLACCRERRVRAWRDALWSLCFTTMCPGTMGNQSPCTVKERSLFVYLCQYYLFAINAIKLLLMAVQIPFIVFPDWFFMFDNKNSNVVI